MEQHTNYNPSLPDPTEVSAKEKSLIVTIVVVLLIVAAMAVVGFIFIKPAPDTIQGMGESTEVRISGNLP